MRIDDLNGIDVNIDEIQYIIRKYKRGQNVIVVTGEFNAGKSSFINCFVNRKGFLPCATTECTPVLVDICEGEEGKIEVRKSDGTVFDIENNMENITKYAKYDENANQNILSIGIPIAESGLPIGTHLIDTPGTNTVLKEHEEITRHVIKKADAVLYLFNKVISKADINHINEILQVTSNIIFVLTHTDETVLGTKQRKYTEQRIEGFLNDAKKDISIGTSIETDDIVICSVGSAEGFENRKEIEQIKSLVAFYVETQTAERKKRIAQRKIEKILQTAIDNYSIKNELLKKREALDQAALETKIKKIENGQSACEKAHNRRIENVNRRMNQQEEVCKSELSRLLAEEKNTIFSRISTGDIEEKSIESRVERLNNDISSQMRSIIEEAIASITREAYESANNSLESISNEFDISVPLMLTVPDIKELDDSRIAARLAGVEKQIEDNLRELTTLKENSSESEVQELEKKIKECEMQKEAVADRLLQLGAYRPEFVTVETEGGASAGRITGRVVGELADLALLIWTPAGAAKEVSEIAKAVKTADKAKDTATLFRYLKAVLGKAAVTSKEVNEKKEKMEKVAVAIKKVDESRREIINRVQEESEVSEKDDAMLSTMLDMLSVGHWTEKLGGVIGEVIKPTAASSIEDVEVKKKYQSRRDEIIEESGRLSNEIYNLKNQLSEIDDFGKQRRVEAEIWEKNKSLEAKKTELEEMRKRAEKQNVDDQIRKHLKSQLDEYEHSQYEKGVRLIQAILGEAKDRIVERVTIDYYEKLDYFNNTISGLREEAISNPSGILDCENKIAVLSGCISDVGTWFE